MRHAPRLLSAFQLVPEVAKQAAKLTVFQRSPNWCAPLHNTKIDAETQRRIHAEQAAPVLGALSASGEIWDIDGVSQGSEQYRVRAFNAAGGADWSNAATVTTPAVPVPGTWETSGIIDTSDFYGKDSWLFVVQAHGPSLVGEGAADGVTDPPARVRREEKATCRLEPINNPFGPKLSPMSPDKSVTDVPGLHHESAQHRS